MRIYEIVTEHTDRANSIKDRYRLAGNTFDEVLEQAQKRIGRAVARIRSIELIADTEL